VSIAQLPQSAMISNEKSLIGRHDVIRRSGCGPGSGWMWTECGPDLARFQASLGPAMGHAHANRALATTIFELKSSVS
jgi:hypothetical protein